jgi:nicotinamidase-related amidase
MAKKKALICICIQNTFIPVDGENWDAGGAEFSREKLAGAFIDNEKTGYLFTAYPVSSIHASGKRI